MIGILWDIDAQPYHRLLRICAERVVKRGDNHQTLRPDLTTEVKHEAVVGHFVRNWTPPDPAIFDEVIAVKVADSPRETLARIVDRLVVILGVPRPTDEAIDEALETAAAYRITTPYHAPAEVSKPFRYYGLAPGIDLEAVTETAIVSAPPDIAQSAKELFEEIKSLNRVITKLHVTLAHEKSVEAEREAAGEGSELGPQEHCWNTCKSITEAKVSPMYAFSITHLVWDNRVMALVIDELRSKEEGPESALPEEVRMHLHVTLGTRTEEISAFESRGILKVAKEGMVRDERNGEADEVVVGGGKVRWIKIGIVQGEGKIRGMY